MVKLKDAKCPNCGANIQVNDKLENTICQYCGSQVVIEEAIEKYKLEISGKVEVDGIKGRNSKLEQARKHIKLDEYDTAKKILQEIIAEDSLDLEAYIELIKVDIELLKKANFNEDSSDLTDYANWNLYNEIINNYNRAKKLDETNSVDGDLGEYKNDLQHYLELKEKIEKDEEELNEIVEKLNKYFDETGSISAECQEVWMNEIVGKHFDISGVKTNFCQYPVNGTYYNDQYKMQKFNRITRDGIVECSYRKVTTTYSTNPLTANLHKTNATPVNSLDEIRNKIAEIDGVTPQYIENARGTTNDAINKANKKLDRQNTVISAKNKFTQIRIYIDYAIIGILALITLSTLFTSGFGAALAIGIFLDSWVIYICVNKIKDHKMDLQLNDINKKTNDLKKRKNV